MIEPFSFGGQAGGTSLIRNYLGFPRGVTGRQLASMAYDQCMLFGAESCFTEATALRAEGGLLTLTLASGAVTGDVVVVAVGVHYARLAARGVDDLLGTGVFYGAAVSDAAAMRGRRVFVVGAGNSAGQAAVQLARYASHVTLLVRGASLAKSMSDYLIKEIEVAPSITVRLKTRGRWRRQAGVPLAARRGLPGSGDGSGGRAVHHDRRPTPHQLAGGHAALRRPRVFPDRHRPDPGLCAAGLGPGTHTAADGGQRSRRLRHRGRPARFGPAGDVGGRRRVDRDPVRPPVPRRAPQPGLDRASADYTSGVQNTTNAAAKLAVVHPAYACG
jgi:hypothetical protein